MDATADAPNDNFYLTSKHIMGPWTNQGLFAPKGTNTYNSQTFKGLTISGSKGEVCNPPPPHTHLPRCSFCFCLSILAARLAVWLTTGGVLQVNIYIGHRYLPHGGPPFSQ